jgi:hypothetical protein
VGFELNKDFIVSSLCINKKVPGSCCEGKCYLKKKLAKQENGESTNRENITPGFDWICNASDFKIPFMQGPADYFLLPSPHLPFQLASGVFHPPGMAFA